MVFDAVLASVKLKAARYITFLDVLKGIEGLDDLVEVIDGKLQLLLECPLEDSQLKYTIVLDIVP